MTFDAALLAGWTALVALSVGATLWWFRQPHSGATAAVVWSSLAALPCVALLLEVLYRLAFDPWPYSFSVVAAIAVLWTVIGPVCLLVGITLSAFNVERPKGTPLVQGTHVLLWIASSLISLLVLAAAL